MASPADEPQGPAPRWASGEPTSDGSREAGLDGAGRGVVAGPAPAWAGVAPAGLPPPQDAAALAATDAPGDAAIDVLVKGRASLAERLWLGFRYYYVRVLAQIRELHPRELNRSWITESLAVGGAFSPGDLRRLQTEGVSAVLDLRAEAIDDAALLARHDIAFLHLPTPDTHAPSLEHFERGVTWVLEQQAEGRRVYVH